MSFEYMKIEKEIISSDIDPIFPFCVKYLIF